MQNTSRMSIEMELREQNKNLAISNAYPQRKSSTEKTYSLGKCLEELKQTWSKKNNSISKLWSEWSRLLGEPLASNYRPLSLRKKVLTIGTNHPKWLQALQYNRIELANEMRSAGIDVKEIRIQQYFPTTKRKVESELSIWAKHPSRADIHGTSICKICSSPSPSGEIALWNKCCICRQKELSLHKYK